MTSQEQLSETGWRALAPEAGTMTVLAGGVLVQALTIFLTTSLMPSAVAEIGGQSLYAWATTAYVIASVVAATMISRVLGRLRAIASYLLGFGLFILGSLLCAVAPVMQVLLIGRAIQGLGGGLLAGLAFTMICRALPEHLWGRGTALVSAMFGVGTLVGPALGGLLAQLGAWRLAFVIAAALAAGLAVLAPRVLPQTERATTSDPLPLLSLTLLVAGVAALSIASIVDGDVWVAVLLIAAAVLLVVFIVVDRAARGKVLPDATYAAKSPLPWIYLTICIAVTAVVVEAFTPLFGQQMSGLPPLAAGFLGATISAGWSFTGLVSVNARSARARRIMVLGGLTLVALGLLLSTAIQSVASGDLAVAGWAIALVVAGAGIGMAFPHLSVAVMSSTDDEGDAAKAAAGIPTTNLIAQALGAATAGVLVNAGLPSIDQAAINLFAGLGILALIGVGAALVTVRTARGLRAEPLGGPAGRETSPSVETRSAIP
ncbi:MFS transporter [Epidermidibacterium keratini]|uniref:MFS transporter n=1 Tax=Epidermidibacterium keratini TaxID=1891644 RepID=A0A7L4YPJ4_9ACTN|nr:MFS transporter [Epidermidibacterium keratini]QHC00719.1 MFS transporter [Epidermidibacterium keratini]